MRIREFAAHLKAFARRLGLGSGPAAIIGPCVLVIDYRYPRTDRNSGDLSTTFYIRMFLSLGYQVVFAAAEQFFETGPYRRQLEAMGVTCVGAGWFASIDKLLKREGARFDICFLCRFNSGGRYFEAARRYCRSAKIVFTPVDLHHLRDTRRAELQGDDVQQDQIARTKARELELVHKADATVVVSSVEKRILDDAVPGARVWHMPMVTECPGRAKPFRERAGIGFVGGFAHQPNGDAVWYFLTEIWPLVRVRLRDVQFFIIGSNLPDIFGKLPVPGVVAIGHVPDLAEPHARLRLTVAPLRYGAGAKRKVLSSMAHGVPCVVTEIAAEGMDLVDGKHVLIGSDPAHFAEQIIRLYEDEALWYALSDAGLARVQEHHSLEAGRARMRKLLDEIGAAPG